MNSNLFFIGAEISFAKSFAIKICLLYTIVVYENYYFRNEGEDTSDEEKESMDRGGLSWRVALRRGVCCIYLNKRAGRGTFCKRYYIKWR